MLFKQINGILSDMNSFERDIITAIETGEKESGWRLGSLYQDKAETRLKEFPIGTERFSPTTSIISGGVLLLGMAAAAYVFNSNSQEMFTQYFINGMRALADSGGVNILKNFASPGGFYLGR